MDNRNRSSVVEEKYRELTLLLIQKGLTITTMESCTSGAIASLITDTEGASAVLKGAFVTYSNEAKILQGVAAETIETYGVYSVETAEAMSRACRRTYAADLGIGVTGSFGNMDPNNADSVPGEIYYAISYGEQICSFFARLPQCSCRRDYKLAAAELVVDKLLSLL